MRILIIKPSSLGDVIHALPFLKAIKDSFHDSVIDWVISRNLKGLLDGNPLINEIITIDKDSWKDIRSLKKTSRELLNLRDNLKRRHYDMVIDLQGLLRSGVISLFASSPVRIGFDDAREGSKYLYNKTVSVSGVSHAVDKNLEVARAIGAEINAIEFPLYIDKRAKEKVNGITDGIKGYIIIFPSARWQTKRWPVENFAELISETPIPCIIAGSKSDISIAKKISELSLKRPLNLCGKTDLKELVALISDAKMVISGDTGPMHIAVALNVPVIALFGPTDPVRTGPYGWQYDNKMKVIRSKVSCSPCFRKRCKNTICMNDISVEMVLKEVKDSL